MIMSTPAPPPTMKALFKETMGSGISLKTVPTPTVEPGSVICQSLVTAMPSQIARRLRPSDGPFLFTHPTPNIPGGYSVGRVVAPGPDATQLKAGQLVICDPFIRGRDDSDVQILWSAFDGPSPASKKLAADSWRHGSLAEYVRAPLENTWAINEARLCGSLSSGGLGYTIPELVSIPVFCVAYGGLRAIDLKAGETIVVSPATGYFSMSTVAIANAMGANVVAVGRDAEKLAKVGEIFPLIKTVVMAGDVAKDTGAILSAAGGHVDVFADVSPPAAVGSNHLESCVAAVKQYGRVVLMGGRADSSLPINYATMVFKNLTIRGSYMYQREDVKGLIKLVESGRLPIGKTGGFPIVGEFPLEKYEEALDMAEKTPFMEGLVTLGSESRI